MNRVNLITQLRELSKLEEHQFKSRAYRNAADQIEYMSDHEFLDRPTFIDIPGIGTCINDKILFYRKNGYIQKLLDLREESRDYLDGEYKVRKSFTTKRIPRTSSEISNILSFIKYNLGYGKIDIVGSYRRNKELIADIDIIAWGTDHKIELEKLLDSRNNVTVVSYGDLKSSWRIMNGYNTTIDVNLGDESCAPFMLLHHTGSASNNISMRAKAKSMGYMLNQYGIFPTYNIIEDDKTRLTREHIRTEEDIFSFLDIPYLEPELR